MGGDLGGLQGAVLSNFEVGERPMLYVPLIFLNTISSGSRGCVIAFQQAKYVPTTKMTKKVIRNFGWKK